MKTLPNTLDFLGTSRRPLGDPDAAAFIAATGITDATQKSAIKTLVSTLKAQGLWAKMHAFWPMVGGTETRHKFNLKDPRDLDAAFRITFSAGWTHDAGGALPNSAYADTHLVPSVVLSPTNGSLGFYSTTNNANSLQYDMGSCDGADLSATIIVCRYGNDAMYLDYGTGLYPNAPSTDGRGFFATNRVDAVKTKGFRNGVGQINQTDAATLAPYSMYIGACNKGGAVAYSSTKKCAGSFIGDGMNSSDHLALYNAIQALNTTLGRQV